MHAKSDFPSYQAAVARRSNAALIAALLLGLIALGLGLWKPGSDWFEFSVQNAAHALSLVLIALVISGKYWWTRQSSREEAAQDRQLQAMLSMFMAVKHELHNDMQVVMGNAELASMMLETGGAAKKPVANINEAAALAIDRIQQLSVFSASMQTAPAAVDLNALLRETSARLTSEISPIVTLRLELDPSLSRILVARNLLSLSLSYLIRLAVRTLPHGGEIVVKTCSVHDPVGDELITATMEIFIIRGLGDTDTPSCPAASDRHQAKYERVLEEARNTTQALVERSGAYVLARAHSEGSELLMKTGFVAANMTTNSRESVVIDEF